MKPILITLLLLFGCLSETLAQYEIPGAQQQPAWVFPLYFEDGFGLRDTAYLGYDPDAMGMFSVASNPIWNSDTVFGEVYHLIEKDSVFDVTVAWGGEGHPYTIKVNVNQYASGYHIMCNHAKLPLKIKWDGSLLYSTDLPFPNQLPLPTVEGIFWVDATADCGGTEPIIISDSTVYFQPECTFADSVVIDHWDCPGCMTNSLFYLDFEPWDGGWTSVESPQQEMLNTHPNPFTEQLHIDLPTNTDRITIRDITGRVVFEQYRNLKGQQLVLNTGAWPPGMYIISAVSDGRRSNLKMLKTN